MQITFGLIVSWRAWSHVVVLTTTCVISGWPQGWSFSLIRIRKSRCNGFWNWFLHSSSQFQCIEWLFFYWQSAGSNPTLSWNISLSHLNLETVRCRIWWRYYLSLLPFFLRNKVCVKLMELSPRRSACIVQKFGCGEAYVTSNPSDNILNYFSCLCTSCCVSNRELD